MRFFYLFVISAFAFVFLAGIAVTIVDDQRIDIYEEQLYRQLVDVSSSKALRVNGFLSEKIEDAFFASVSATAKSSFKQDYFFDVDVMRNRVKTIVFDTGANIEEYLLENPDKSWEELRNDSEFRKIAIRRSGIYGYTVIISAETGEIILHKYPPTEGLDLLSEDIKERLPEQYELIRRGVEGKRDAEGFYDWQEPTGEIKKKYAYNKYSEVGDKKYIFAANIYLDEQNPTVRIAESAANRIRDFQMEKSFSDMIFISASGDVIWSAEYHNELGTNILTGIYNESSLGKLFRSTRDNLKHEVSDSEEYEVTGELGVFVMAPVIDLDKATGEVEFLGALAIRIDNKDIEKLIASDIGFEEIGEIYIVNKDKRYVTPLRANLTDYSEGIINSEIINRCLLDCGDLVNSGDVSERRARDFNYAGEKTFGGYSCVENSGWCVIAEVGEDDFLRAKPNFKKMFIVSVIIAFVFLFFIFLIFSSFFRFDEGGIK